MHPVRFASLGPQFSLPLVQNPPPLPRQGITNFSTHFDTAGSGDTHSELPPGFQSGLSNNKTSDPRPLQTQVLAASSSTFSLFPRAISRSLCYLFSSLENNFTRFLFFFPVKRRGLICSGFAVPISCNITGFLFAEKTGSTLSTTETKI